MQNGLLAVHCWPEQRKRPTLKRWWEYEFGKWRGWKGKENHGKLRRGFGCIAYGPDWWREQSSFFPFSMTWYVTTNKMSALFANYNRGETINTPCQAPWGPRGSEEALTQWSSRRCSIDKRLKTKSRPVLESQTCPKIGLLVHNSASQCTGQGSEGCGGSSGGRQTWNSVPVVLLTGR